MVSPAVSSADDKEAATFRSSLARMLGIALNRVGNTNKQLKRFAQAREAYEEARVILKKCPDRRIQLATTLNNQGILEGIEATGVAEERVFAEATELSRQLKQPEKIFEIQLNLGTALVRAKDEPAALAHYLKPYAQMPPGVTYDDRTALLQNIVSNLVELGRSSEAAKYLDGTTPKRSPDRPSYPSFHPSDATHPCRNWERTRALRYPIGLDRSGSFVFVLPMQAAPLVPDFPLFFIGQSDSLVLITWILFFSPRALP